MYFVLLYAIPAVILPHLCLQINQNLCSAPGPLQIAPDPRQAEEDSLEQEWKLRAGKVREAECCHRVHIPQK